MSKIIRPDSLEWPEEFNLKKIGISQSLIAKWFSCQRLFLFAINGYRNESKAQTTNFGNLVHDVNEKIYKENELPSNFKIKRAIDEYIEKELKKTNRVLSQQFLEFEGAKAEAVLKPYYEFYKKDFKLNKYFDVEKVFEVNYGGFKLVGKTDAKHRVKNNKKWIDEHKTKGQISEDILLLHLPLNFQNRMYILADEISTNEIAEGVKWNVIRNPQHRQSKTESLKAYMKRVENEVRNNPLHFFKRWETPYSKKSMVDFGHELNTILHNIKDNIGKPVLPNRWSCEKPWPCPMLKACSTNSVSCLTKSEEPMKDYLFPELKENEDGSKNKAVKRIVKRKDGKKIVRRVAKGKASKK